MTAINLHTAGPSWLATTKNAKCSVSVTYRRESRSVSLNARLGRTRYERTDEEGMTLAGYSTDFLFSASSLVLDGRQCEPRRGDRIIYTAGLKERTYEVMPLNPGEQCYRYCGGTEQRLRVHTRQVTSVRA